MYSTVESEIGFRTATPDARRIGLSDSIITVDLSVILLHFFRKQVVHEKFSPAKEVDKFLVSWPIVVYASGYCYQWLMDRSEANDQEVLFPVSDNVKAL